LPEVKGRKEIMQYYLDKVKYAKDLVDVDAWGRRTTGFSGADIKNFVNLAVLNSIKTNKPAADRESFDFAYDRIIMGIRRPGLLSDEDEKRATAFHEVGHALIAFLKLGAKS
jgi:ATP-dependent Zn protease